MDSVRIELTCNQLRFQLFMRQSLYKSIVCQVGLEPTNPNGREFTVLRLCRFATDTFIVTKEGLEPPRLSTSVSKTDVCCHFTTWPLIDRLLLLVLSDLRLPVIDSTRYCSSLSTNPKGVPLALVFVCLIAV